MAPRSWASRNTALWTANKAAVAGRTWKQLWLEFPELLTTLLESLTSGFGSGDQPFATRFAISAMAMCLANPLCNLILQRPLSVLVAGGMGGKLAVLKVDGNILKEGGEANVTKAAIEPVWFLLESVITAFGLTPDIYS